MLLGTSVYPADDGLEALPGVVENLAELRRLLTDPASGGFRSENCSVVLNPASPLEMIAPLRARSKEANDVLLIYYAGHGLLEDATNDLHLCTTNTSRDVLAYTALAFDDLKRELHRLNARAKVLMLDCCFSGRAIDAMSDAQSVIAGQVEVAGSYTLTATLATKTAVAPVGARMTAFTDALVGLLDHGVTDGSEYLDLQTIYVQLRQRLKAAGLPEPMQANTQGGQGLALAKNRAWVNQKDRRPSASPARERSRELAHKVMAWVEWPKEETRREFGMRDGEIPWTVYVRNDGDEAVENVYVTVTSADGDTAYRIPWNCPAEPKTYAGYVLRDEQGEWFDRNDEPPSAEIEFSSGGFHWRKSHDGVRSLRRRPAG